MIGTCIGQYVLEEELGRGAFGTVFKGHHQRDSKDLVAIKILEKTGQLDRQMAEPEILSRLKHPNIVRLREYFVHEDQLVMVLDYISGGDLKTALENGREFSQAEVKELLRSMASALAFAHERNIVHRDIKMANIMLEESSEQLRFILTDFGIGRIAEGVQDRPNTGGTFLFMAPEQFRGRPVPQSDLWAVGVVAYRLLSGKMPFQGDSLNDLSRSILYSNPLAPSRAAGKQIEEKLDLVVAQLLEKSLNERVASAKELLRLLETSSGTILQSGGALLQSFVGHSLVGQFVAEPSMESGMDRFMARMRLQRKVCIVFASIFAVAIALGHGFFGGILIIAGTAMFYLSQTKNGANTNTNRLLIGAFAALAVAWVLTAITNEKSYNKGKVSPQKIAKINKAMAGIPSSAGATDQEKIGETINEALEKIEEKVEEAAPDSKKPGGIKVNVDDDWSGLLKMLSFVSYPLFAISVAAHRRAGRKLANCALLVENPKSDPHYISKLRDSVAERPNDILFRIKFVEAMLAEGMLEDVIVECQLILEIDPYNFNANLLLANSFIELGLLEDAAMVCQDYLAVSGYCFEFQMLLERCGHRGGPQ